MWLDLDAYFDRGFILELWVNPHTGSFDDMHCVRIEPEGSWFLCYGEEPAFRARSKAIDHAVIAAISHLNMNCDEPLSMEWMSAGYLDLEAFMRAEHRLMLVPRNGMELGIGPIVVNVGYEDDQFYVENDDGHNTVRTDDCADALQTGLIWIAEMEAIKPERDSFRFFIFEDDGSIRRIAQKIALGFVFPEYANRRVRYAMVFLSLRAGKPRDIQKIDAGYLQCDETGNSQPAGAQSALDKMVAWEQVKREKDMTGPVISIAGRLAHDRVTRETRWEPSEAELKQIEAAIWPRGRPT